MLSKSIKLLFIGLVGVSIAGALFIWFGVFNIAGNDKHWDSTTSMLELVRDRSITTRSANISVPNLSGSERIAKAAPNYAAMCAQCHLAPGMKDSELYEGLYPQPPVFNKLEKYTRQPQETFWVIKNGIKMTGMPAWGIYNSDEQIWDLVAMISKINSMTPEQYQELVDAGEHTHMKGGHAGSETKSNHHQDTSSGEMKNTDHHSSEAAPSSGHHHNEANGHDKKPASDHHNKVSDHDKTPHGH